MLEVWLARGAKVTVGGRELILMPLPLSRLHSMAAWLEVNANDVVQEVLATMSTSKKNPNPFEMVSKVLLRINVSEVVFELFCWPKNPETGELLNSSLTKEFFDDYLDVPTAHEIFQKLVQLNELGALLKNLQSLPVIKKLWEAATLTYGIPFLNSFQLSTDFPLNKQENSPFPKSTDMSQPATTETLGNGSSMTGQKQEVESKLATPKNLVQ